MTAKVLLVEDSPSLAKLYASYLKEEDIDLSLVATGAEALAHIREQLPHLVLLDLKLPDMDGMAILAWMHAQELPCDTIIVTAHGSVDIAVEALRNGAADFIEKPFDAKRLRVTLNNVLERNRLKHLVADYRATYEREQYHGFIGASPPMQAVYRTIEAAASSNATVFITGESGTGKEVCADAIHRQGLRAKGPFVAINCGAIPKDLVESELFGHVKGAFTGAVSERKGAVSRADGGTLFLDELGEMELELQTKLLRFLQTGSFLRVGGSKEEKVDVRIICATNRVPLEEVAAGRLREDLYYRLHVIPLQMPPLRERGADILLIARHLLGQYAGEENKRFGTFAPEVEAVLLDYPWPGNVRQLQNVVRNIVVLHNAERVEVAHLPPPLDRHTPGSPASVPPMSATASVPPVAQSPLAGAATVIKPLAQVEREAIEAAIAYCDGNIPRAAALLEVSPSTLYRKKQAWGAA